MQKSLSVKKFREKDEKHFTWQKVFTENYKLRTFGLKLTVLSPSCPTQCQTNHWNHKQHAINETATENNWHMTEITVIMIIIIIIYYKRLLQCCAQQHSTTTKITVMDSSFMMQNISKKFWPDHPERGRQMQVELTKIVFSDQSISLWLRHLAAKQSVSIHHSGLHPQWCAGRGICGVINNVGDSEVCW